MEIRFHSLAAAVFIVALAHAADPAKKTTAPIVTKSNTKRIPVRISKSTSRPAAKGNSKSNVRAAAYSAPHQANPSSDRYREIQESLMSKGYLQGPATGVWDQSSMDAMKKFQEDQKLDPTGKITAKSLINLGLGPKDEAAPSANK